MHTADHYLLNRWILQRDAQAFKELTSRYSAMVFGTSVRILKNASDAEEVTQECFAALASSRQSPQGSMGAWLHRIATYQALNRRRTEQRRTAREEQFARSCDDTTEIKWCDISQFIDQCIESLPEGIRTAIVGHFIENETLTEIAARECVTHGAISQRIQKGVSIIRERMRQNGMLLEVAVLTALLTEHASAWPAVPGTLTTGLGKLALAGGSSTAAPQVRKSLTTGKLLVGAAAVVLVTTLTVAAIKPSQAGPVSVAQPPPAVMPPSIGAEARQFKSSGRPGAGPSAAPETPAASAAALKQASSELKTWREVVGAYTEHQDCIRRIRFDYEHAARGNYDYTLSPGSPGRGYREFFERGALITDGERCAIRHFQWGEQYGGEIRSEDRAAFATLAFDGTDYISYMGGSSQEAPGLIDMQPNVRHSPLADSAFRNGRSYLLFARYPGGAMLGFPLPNGYRMEEFLNRARKVALRPSKELVGSSACYVIDADLDYGDFTVWFDPDHDFNIAKSVIEVAPGDMHELHRLNPGVSEHYIYHVDSFANVDGLWVPESSTSEKVSRAGVSQGHNYTHVHRRSFIRLLAPGEDDAAYQIAAEDIADGSALMEFGVVVRNGDPRWRWFDDRLILTTETGIQVRRSDKTLQKGFGGGMISGSIYE